MYPLQLVMVIVLHVFLLLTPCQLPLVLPLLLSLQILLKPVDLRDQLGLVCVMGHSVLLDGDAYLHDVLLQFDSLAFRVFVVFASIGHIL